MMKPSDFAGHGVGLVDTVSVVSSTGSTNADVLHGVSSGEMRPGAVLIAHEQTAGRGRLGRSWSSPKDSQIAMSIAVPTGNITDLGFLPLAAGLAVREGLASACAVSCDLKWPNDVLDHDGRKLCGILVELTTTRQSDGIESVAAVGIGINVTNDFPDDIAGRAVNLATLGASSLDHQSIIASVLDAFAARYAQLRAGSIRLRSDYRNACVTVGREVIVSLPDGTSLTGTAVGIDEGGRLVVDSAGVATPVSAGDVVHVR